MDRLERIDETIKTFILENFLFSSDPGSIAGDSSFLEKGIVDSTGVLEIVGFLEEKFGIKVEDEEVVPDNLDCIDKIASYVKRKRASNDMAK